MGPWQTLGFLAGCACAGLTTPEPGDDDGLAMDLLDEMARMDGDDEPKGFDDGPPQACLDAMEGDVTAFFARVCAAVEAEEGGIDPGLGGNTSRLPEAREYARGILRGIPFVIEDDDLLEEEAWSEPLGLLFILAEEDLGPGFGSAKELHEARVSVLGNLPGITSAIYKAASGD